MEIIIDQNNADQRFDRFMRKYCKIYPEVKLGDIYLWIRKGNIKVNGKKSKEEYRLQIGDKVEFEKDVLGKKDLRALISPKERKIKKLEKDEIKNMIIYEDINWIVFDKPSGVVIHPSNKHWSDLCMNDYLETYVSKSLNIESETFKPSFGYRLDKDTSGVLIAAKNYVALQYINEIIRDRKIEKKYLTIVVGDFPNHLLIDKSLEKIYDKKFDRSHMIVDKSGIKARTECWNKKTIYHPDFGQISLVEIKIDTGRMHQIRIHLSSEGYPVLGDIIYGNPAVNRKLYKKLNINRQLLHCWKYSFVDISSKKNKEFQSDVPSDFNRIIELN
ncbi:RluA family pseudouridine synthase [Candidatus Gracilibacteria bacterium]|nr:RluA family pseudouridine synthase [Candidatus Gracilibacteria bacterium]